MIGRLFVLWKRWKMRRKLRACGCPVCARNLDALEILWADQDNALLRVDGDYLYQSQRRFKPFTIKLKGDR